MVVDVRLVVPDGHPRAEDVGRAVQTFVERVADEVDGSVIVTAYPSHPEKAPRLTGRQLEVLRLLDRGLLTKQIARELGISTHTANNHVRAILRRFDVATRTAALHTARRLHLI
ncbi:MAG: response regulator transcription factor [Actinobacteria bacterium]|nr:response regulator transcription factor [Actinomycetota bacterium]